MNANELADKLSDKTMRDYIVFEYLPEIVSMLRQQQAEIKKLKEKCDLLQEGYRGLKNISELKNDW